MHQSFEHVFAEANAINRILSRYVAMSTLTAAKQAEHDRALVCHNCNANFSSQNPKAHHSHVTGGYFFSACANCNLALKLIKCRSNCRKDAGDGDVLRKDYLVPIVFHNLSAYDGNLVLHFLTRIYRLHDEMRQDRIRRRGGDTYERRKKSATENRQRRICGFVPVSRRIARQPRQVDAQVRTGRLRAHHQTLWMRRVVLPKGSFPYDFMTDVSVFAETALPPKSAF